MIGVLGSGSWGSALAMHIARIENVMLWGHNKDDIKVIQETRYNPKYLPNIQYPENIIATDSLKELVQNCDQLVFVVPSFALLSILKEIKSIAHKELSFINATKGLEHDSNRFFSEMIDEIFDSPVQAVLSGPSFASEVARHLPTAITIASKNERDAKSFLPLFHHHHMRVYLNSDPIGVQLAGTYKNVIAIAAGISEGLGFGCNARAALITRGLAEMTRLGVSLGASVETFLGLAGVGDLTLTATSTESRNYRFGKLIGEGFTKAEAFEKIFQVVEGANNVINMKALGEKQSIELPIVAEVYKILTENLDPQIAMINLLERSAKSE
ncbi:NAD(P)H-dependent glycerol-3-phosphate dehydrogenase [Wohlfahrtiimonas larvae]|uniref:Glycerol-3-phosphate dehydrogenase [NAD(P)+] n=2 Tax=Wohlfahrtiimonas larvae TaxID=1157986 RepID=A0ABP9MAY5_9GAMM